MKWARLLALKSLAQNSDFQGTFKFSNISTLNFQCEKWSTNPDLFVEDEDEDSFSYSVRISAQDLLMVSLWKWVCELLF